MGLVRLLPLKIASALGARLAAPVLPLVWRRGDHLARRHLKVFFPEKDQAWHHHTRRNLWNHIAQTIFESPHFTLSSLRPRTEITGEDKVRAFVQAGKPIIFAAAHFGNWEAISIFISQFYPPERRRYNSIIYRPANNPWINRMILARRRRTAELAYVKKGLAGARIAMQSLEHGGFAGILFDQKMNEGVKATFFGRAAMTTSFPARMAAKYRCPIIPVHCRRLPGARFALDYEEPLWATGSSSEAIHVLTQMLNDRLEARIRQTPDQWLWTHQRWGPQVL